MREPSCRAVRREIQERMDDEDRALSDAARRHLGRCASCRAFVESYGAVSSAVRAGLDEELGSSPPPDLSRILEGSRPADSHRRAAVPLRWVAVLAGAVLLSGLGFYGLHMHGGRSRAPAVVQESTREFVSRLYERSLWEIEGAESGTADSVVIDSALGWFDETGLTVSLLEPFPSFEL